MIQTMESILRPYVERHLGSWSQHLALMDVAANNIVNVGIGYSPFYLNFGDYPIIPSILLHGGDVSSHVEVRQTMVDQMKTTLEEDQVNPTIIANRVKAHANALQRAEKFDVGNEVVLKTKHLRINEHLPVKPRRQ